MSHSSQRVVLPLTRWWRAFGSAPGPLSLAGSRGDWVWAGVFVVCILGVTLLEAMDPGLSSLGALLFIPVVASAWLLGSPQAAAVSTLALAGRLVGYSVAGVDLGTTMAEVAALAALGVTTRMAAVGLVETREQQNRIDRAGHALELLKQRDAIAGRVTDTAIRRLFAMTLNLQAALSLSDGDATTKALHQTIADVDSLIADLRTVVFKPEE